MHRRRLSYHVGRSARKNGWLMSNFVSTHRGESLHWPLRVLCSTKVALCVSRVCDRVSMSVQVSLGELKGKWSEG